ncbi:putative glutamine amidotransferase [Caminicella sporogenes DSM 14501]|uniref:Putative glutamine amidotransferase n=1 Tax=Caminicella sporogenes DSM 14501 TaxID=1121266 RepID=A0A1M6QFN8_9FIRM|nr:gamma-glutamyl-gamma-aminobutyrate hydrolase family protein [Caminicella sporogenes]RKD25334.1 hypothetical protein BET04_03740 [Caminicella sporogenes]SHK18877.1 putative glutamine amidotransferase [Caminicella sporogenes DSM 14501]
MKPLIGITTYLVKDRELKEKRYRGLPGQDMQMSTMDYSRCIKKAGGIPVTIPVIHDDDYIEELSNILDGFLFSGGPDIYPFKYGQALKKGIGLINPERDDFEFKLLDKVLKKDKPVFGICRGFQLINVYFGGTLYQDISKTNMTDIEHVGIMIPKYEYCHDVIIDNESKLYLAFKTNKLKVNSFHHQAIDKLGEGLLKTAWSKDGIIEGFEHPDYSFIVGVQWHPEMMVEVHKEQLSVFQLFINNIKRLRKNV